MIAVRDYRAEDRDALADLWVAAWQATMPDIDFVARRGWICERLNSQREDGTATIVAVLQEAAAGFAMVEPARGHLEQLVVRPREFGAGVGKILLDAAKLLSPAALTLRVNQDNPRAVRFYAREGFRVVAEGVNPGGRLKVWDMEWRAG